MQPVDAINYRSKGCLDQTLCGGSPTPGPCPRTGDSASGLLLASNSRAAAGSKNRTTERLWEQGQDNARMRPALSGWDGAEAVGGGVWVAYGTRHRRTGKPKPEIHSQVGYGHDEKEGNSRVESGFSECGPGRH